MEVIRNLKELNIEKEKIESLLTKNLDDPMNNIFTFFKAFRKDKKRKKDLKKKKVETKERNEFMDEGVKAALTLIAGTMATKFKLGRIPKLVVVAGVSLATPYIVDFIQKKINS